MHETEQQMFSSAQTSTPHPRSPNRRALVASLSVSACDVQPVRLQKFLADAGVASRRQAEALIAAGAVSVNRQTARLGSKVLPGVDRVVVRGRVIRAVSLEKRQRVALALNKPRGMTCAREAVGRHTSIFDLVPSEYRKARLAVAGELDTEAEGLVILTDDGTLRQRIVHPAGGLLKRYLVVLKEPLPTGRLEQLSKGFLLEGQRLRAELVEPVAVRPDGTCLQVMVGVLQDRKQLVRRLFDMLRADIVRLRRVQIGGFGLKRIPLRGWKVVSKQELLGFVPAAPRAVKR